MNSHILCKSVTDKKLSSIPTLWKTFPSKVKMIMRHFYVSHLNFQAFSLAFYCWFQFTVTVLCAGAGSS